MNHWTNAELFEHYNDLSHALGCVRTILRDRKVPWQQLAAHGLKAEAVLMYKREHDVPLREANDVVIAFLAQLDD